MNKTDISHTDRSRCPRVGIVTTSFPVTKSSSSGVFVERLAARIGRRADLTVLVPSPDGHTDVPAGKPYRVSLFSYGKKQWQRLAHHPGGIPDALRRRDPVILLIPLFVSAMFIACLRLAGKVDIMHGNWSVPGLVAAVAARIRRVPAIATVRGEDVTRIDQSLLFRLIFKSLLIMNHYVVVVSEAMQANLRNRFTRWSEKIVFIPNGVSIDSTGIKPPFRSPLRLLSVGSLIRRKRIETLLNALSELKNQPTISLRIIGDGPEREYLEETARSLAVQDFVSFAGNVPPEEIAEHLQWADIFVFASESEGRPNAVLEAMAAGLPVIATDIPGVRELIETDSGMLYPVGDASALAQCIQDMAGNQDRAFSMGRAGIQRINDSGLTWGTAARRYIMLYEKARKGYRT